MLNLSKKGNAALYYTTKLGWAVIPLHSIESGQCTCKKEDCQSKGKHPLTFNGVKDAAKDKEQIIKWWRQWPFANIGIATGLVSGFFVLDIDGWQGEESLRELEEARGKLPDTVEQLTGGGGRHLLFKATRETPNKVALAEGIDIRGDGGYIVAAPSEHITGLTYQWEVSSLPGKTPIAEAPEWLLGMLEPQKGLSRSENEWRNLIRNGAAEGKRNDSIASLTGHLLRHYVDPYVTAELVLMWNESRCKPPLPEEEVLKTIDSVAKLEARRREVAR